jgi:serine phosphatase RsbU (regulator of sigma subunit)
VIAAPIYSLSSGEFIGGVAVVVRWWPNKIIPYFLPAVQSLAALVSSTLHQAEVTAQMLAHERVTRELALAGEIQASLLPQTLPRLPGWDLAAVLEPSRETSGDFYDLIPLPSGRIGIVVADVADKGIGAALYMTLSRTLIRTYAVEHEHRPDLVLRAVNQRLLADTQADMFVTIFYGVIDPVTGRLDYCNAGHNPPYLIQASQVALKNTGMALGILAEAPMQRASVLIEHGSVLVLYTDGIPDARNMVGEFFDVHRLLETVQSCLAEKRSKPCGSEKLRDAILTAVHEFMHGAAQEDDLTLLVLVRENSI